MRALFTLLLIYFLTGILQITGDNTFAKKNIGFTEEADTTEIECIVSSDFDLCESLLENQEDNDHKTLTFSVKNTTFGTFPKSLNSSGKRTNTADFKHILILYTNLPPPTFIA
ncbi:hypothetical protein [uncultured Draconibacterium sp.]|uniref:hypothetical protein n=1 Tax=uncultured Draconibacterium sp. TaxID=1573823 RepID=UPI0029C94F87|nr:hypothetical protein [uncultured Draconibacterium sp.]